MDKFEIKNTLYKRNLKSRPLSILLYLIDRANEDLVCFPSIKTISSDLNISVSTTKRVLNSLVEIGLIEKIERFLDTTGKQTSNLYVINIENIKNYSFSSKIEKVEDEKEVLEVFENVRNENIKQNVNLENISENTKYDVENTEEISLSSKKIVIEKDNKNIFIDDKDYHFYNESPLKIKTDLGFILFNILCSINYAIIFVEKCFVEEIPQKLKFSYS